MRVTRVENFVAIFTLYLVDVTLLGTRKNSLKIGLRSQWAEQRPSSLSIVRLARAIETLNGQLKSIFFFHPFTNRIRVKFV